MNTEYCKDVLYTLHNLKQVTEIPTYRKYHVLAYKVTTANMVQCFLRMYVGKLVNPLIISLSELKHYDEHFVRVNEDIYNRYHKILNGQSKTPLNSLERLLS